jgi:hypothetical protein
MPDLLCAACSLCYFHTDVTFWSSFSVMSMQVSIKANCKPFPPVQDLLSTLPGGVTSIYAGLDPSCTSAILFCLFCTIQLAAFTAT